MSYENNQDRGFTSTEVGTLIEEFRGDIKLFAEGFSIMSGDIHNLKEDVHELKSDMKLVKDAIKIAIPAHDKRITRLELKAAG